MLDFWILIANCREKSAIIIAKCSRRQMEKEREREGSKEVVFRGISRVDDRIREQI